MRALIRFLIRAYQLLLSPLLGPRCRFYPSCSQYALEAVSRHGSVAGSWLVLCRLARCHPLHAGGYDPVPAAPPVTVGPHVPSDCPSHGSSVEAIQAPHVFHR